MNGIIFLSIIIFLLICVLTKLVNVPLTSKLYIINTYMYIILGLLFVFVSWLSIEKNTNLFNIITSKYFIIFIVIITFMALFIISSINNSIIKHIFWLIYILSIGIITYSVYRKNKINGNIYSVLISVIILVLVLSFIAYKEPLGKFDSLLKPMIILLLTLIVIQIGELFVYKYNNKNFVTRFRIYSIIGLILFSGFMLYDTQSLIKNSNSVITNCSTLNNPMNCTDYPKESLNIFIDIISLFSNMSNK